MKSSDDDSQSYIINTASKEGEIQIQNQRAQDDSLDSIERELNEISREDQPPTR